MEIKQTFDLKCESSRYVLHSNDYSAVVEIIVGLYNPGATREVIQNTVLLPKAVNLCDLDALIKLLNVVKDRGAQLENDFRRIFDLSHALSTAEYVAKKIATETPPDGLP